jgi:hypothetical protein
MAKKRKTSLEKSFAYFKKYKYVVLPYGFKTTGGKGAYWSNKLESCKNYIKRNLFKSKRGYNIYTINKKTLRLKKHLTVKLER